MCSSSGCFWNPCTWTSCSWNSSCSWINAYTNCTTPIIRSSTCSGPLKLDSFLGILRGWSEADD
jgi:hypothetical protein